MKDSTHIKAAKKDVEQRLLQKNDDLSGSVNCLNEMKKIATLIEAVSIPPFSTLSCGPIALKRLFPSPSLSIK